MKGGISKGHACYFVTIVVLLANHAAAQTVFEDSKGETSVFLPVGGAIRVNTTDANVRFSYVDAESNSPWRAGVLLTGKAVDGVATVIKNGQTGAELEATFTLGHMWGEKKQDSNLGWLTLQARYKSARYRVASSAIPSQGLVEEAFGGFGLALSATIMRQPTDGFQVFAGLSIGARKQNNYQAMTEVEMVTSLEVDSTRTLESGAKGRIGSYAEYVTVPLLVDVVLIPSALQNRIGVTGFFRSTFDARTGAGTTIDQMDAGAGIYILKKDDPRYVVGGLIIEMQDLDDAAEKGNSLSDRIQASLVVGFYFD